MVRRQQGFSVMQVLLCATILGIVGLAGWLVYQAHRSTPEAHDVSTAHTVVVTDFDQCAKTAGDVVRQTYPETCATKAGEVFTDTTGRRHLVIKEWGVQLVLGADLADATYSVLSRSVDPQSESVGLSSRSATAQSADCAADRMGMSALVRQTAAVHDANVGKPDTATDPHPVYPKKIGGYYYQYHQETGIAGMADHPDGTCGDYASGLKYAAEFQTAFDRMTAVP